MSNLPEWTGPNAPDLQRLPELTALEAFDAMRLFIEAYWMRGLKQSDDLRMVLSALNREIRMWPDGGPADPAMWSDWLRAIGAVKDVDLSAEADQPIR